MYRPHTALSDDNDGERQTHDEFLCDLNSFRLYAFTQVRGYNTQFLLYPRPLS